MPTKGKMTPTCAMCQQVGMSVRLCEKHACLRELVETARSIIGQEDRVAGHDTLIATCTLDTLRRILARIDEAFEAMREALRHAEAIAENYSDELNAARFENAEELARRFRGRRGDAIHKRADEFRAALALADKVTK